MATQLQPPQEISFSFDPWLKSNLNFGEPDEHVYRNGRLARQGSVVCKHWLKGNPSQFLSISLTHLQDSVRKVTPANFSMNTIYARCPNVQSPTLHVCRLCKVTFSTNTDTVRMLKNVFIDTLIPFRGSECVLGTREDSVRWDRTVVRGM